LKSVGRKEEATVQHVKKGKKMGRLPLLANSHEKKKPGHPKRTMPTNARQRGYLRWEVQEVYIARRPSNPRKAPGY